MKIPTPEAVSLNQSEFSRLLHSTILLVYHVACCYGGTYIGCTGRGLSQRKSEHRANWLARPILKSTAESVGIDFEVYANRILVLFCRRADFSSHSSVEPSVCPIRNRLKEIKTAGEH